MTVDLDALRAYLEDCCGTAVASGLPAALFDLIDLEGMSGHELCAKAEELGIDLCKFSSSD